MVDGHTELTLSIPSILVMLCMKNLMLLRLDIVNKSVKILLLDYATSFILVKNHTEYKIHSTSILLIICVIRPLIS